MHQEDTVKELHLEQPNWHGKIKPPKVSEQLSKQQGMLHLHFMYLQDNSCSNKISPGSWKKLCSTGMVTNNSKKTRRPENCTESVLTCIQFLLQTALFVTQFFQHLNLLRLDWCHGFADLCMFFNHFRVTKLQVLSVLHQPVSQVIPRWKSKPVNKKNWWTSYTDN